MDLTKPQRGIASIAVILAALAWLFPVVTYERWSDYSGAWKRVARSSLNKYEQKQYRTGRVFLFGEFSGGDHTREEVDYRRAATDTGLIALATLLAAWVVRKP